MNLIPIIANYITRYAPSEKRLRQYLAKKKCYTIDEILEQIHYDETLMAQLWVKSFIAVGKGEREMRIKLQKKEFPKDLIESLLSVSENEIHDWQMNHTAVENQISTLESRGKSKQVIVQQLVSRYPYFRDEIAEIMSETTDTMALEKEIEKYRTRYDLRIQKEKQKFYAAILRKGFRFDDIKRMLSSKN